MKSQPQFRPAAIPRRPLTRLCAAWRWPPSPPCALAQAPAISDDIVRLGLILT